MNVFCVLLHKFATFWNGQEHGNSRCPWVYFMQPSLAYAAWYCVQCRRICIHGVGFCVARSTVPGNAKASKRGTGDGQSSHAFFVYTSQYLFINRLDMGIRAQKRKDKLPRKGLLFLMVHIGKAIKAELERQERSVTWFAKKLYCERTNVYSIFKRESIDTELLLRISIVLHRNFFMDYIDELSKCDFSSTKQ